MYHIFTRRYNILPKNGLPILVRKYRSVDSSGRPGVRFPDIAFRGLTQIFDSAPEIHAHDDSTLRLGNSQTTDLLEKIRQLASIMPTELYWVKINQSVILTGMQPLQWDFLGHGICG